MTDVFRRLDERTLVHGQLTLDDIAAARAAGVTTVINNRPDNEEPGQISSEDLEIAARAAGMDYLFAPSHGMPDQGVVSAVSRALSMRTAEDVTLMFCKSGMRSTVAWAMAESRAGADPDHIRRAATEAGYDLSRLPL